MTKKIRTILTLVFLFLFLIITPVIVLYSQGYRFDFNPSIGRIKIIQTGGFYFKVNPSQVSVYLNEKFKKKTSIIFNAAFIKDLLPKSYRIQVKKDGYYTWEKKLEIKEKLVTEAKNIVLIPENPNFKLLEKDIDDFFLTPDKKKIILKSETEDGWVLINFNLENETQDILLSEKDFEKNADILNLKWSSDSKKYLLETISNKQKEYSVFHLEGNECRKKIGCPIDFLNQEVKKISFIPNQDLKIFFLKKDSLFKKDYFKEEISQNPILNEVVTYSIFDKDIIWLNNDGFLLLSDFSGKIKQILNLKPFEVKENKEYGLEIIDRSKIFLFQENLLFFLDPNQKIFEDVSDSIRNLKVSPDKRRVVYFNDYEIWIFSLEEDLGQPSRKFQEKVFLTRFSEKINEIFWFTSHYLIFSTGSEVKIAEIDNRDKINIVNINKFKNPKIFWDQFNKKLLVLNEKKLFISEKLLK